MDLETARAAVFAPDDRCDGRPWEMLLAVRVDPADPPTPAAVAEVVAMATVRLLTDPRRHTAAGWEHAFDRWDRGGATKQVLAVPASRWMRVGDLPGLTTVHAGVRARALVPTRTAHPAPPLADLPQPEDVVDGAAARPRPAAGLPVLTVAIAPTLGWRQTAAAAADAAQAAWLEVPEAFHDRWVAAGFPVTVEQPDAARFAVLAETAPVVVHDAGLTVPPERGPDGRGPVTAVASWS